MEVSQGQLLALLVASLGTGLFMGLFWELLAAFRIVLGAYVPPERMRTVYERPLPLLSRSVPFDSKKHPRRLWRGLVIAVLDLLFCLCFGIALILLLYRYQNGVLRLSAPIAALIAYAAFHRVALLTAAPAVSYLAYGISAARLYAAALLALPFRGLGLLYRRCILPPVCAAADKIRARRAARRSAALCAMQLAQARNGLSPADVKTKGTEKHGKKDTWKNNAAAVGDPHSDPCHRGGRDRDRST